MTMLREAMLRVDETADDDPQFVPHEEAHEAVGRALQVTPEQIEALRREQAEVDRRERKDDATADAMEIVMRVRSRHGRTKWSRADGRAVTGIVDILCGLVGDGD